MYSPCGNLIDSSTNRGASPDSVTIWSEERLAYNDSFYYYVEVRWYSGNLCYDYRLVFEGRGTCDE